MAAGGIAGAIALVAWAVLSVPVPVRFLAPGSATFEAAVPGRYTLWHEHRTVYEGRTWNREPALPEGVRLRVSNPSGGELAVERTSGGSWKDGPTERASLAGFEVQEAGPHRVDVEGEMDPAVLAVARDFLWPMIAAIAGAALVALLGMGGGLALGLYTLARRLESAGPPRVGPARDPFAPSPALAPPRDTDKPLRDLVALVYALQAASLLVGVTLVAGVVVDYLKRGEAAGTWLESHVTWQIRTFWWTLGWGALGLATAVLVVGFLVLFATAIWFIYRVARGWIALSERKPVG